MSPFILGETENDYIFKSLAKNILKIRNSLSDQIITELSVSGGTVNMYNAVKMAMARTK